MYVMYLPPLLGPLDGSSVKVPDQVVVELQSLHVCVHIDSFIHGMRVLLTTLARGGPAVNVLREVYPSTSAASHELQYPSRLVCNRSSDLLR